MSMTFSISCSTADQSVLGWAAPLPGCGHGVTSDFLRLEA
jgi:hypothetical protein